MYLNLILLGVALFVLLPIALAWRSFAPWVPTKTADIERVFRLADLKEGDIFYDLGAGDGRMVLYASKKFGAKSIGLELAFPFFLAGKLRQWIAGDKRAVIKWKNLYKENLSPADVIYIFGTEETLGENFQKKLQKEVKPAARVISYAFRIGTLAPKIVDKPSNKHLPVYVYQF